MNITVKEGVVMTTHWYFTRAYQTKSSPTLNPQNRKHHVYDYRQKTPLNILGEDSDQKLQCLLQFTHKILNIIKLKIITLYSKSQSL